MSRKSRILLLLVQEPASKEFQQRWLKFQKNEINS